MNRKSTNYVLIFVLIILNSNRLIAQGESLDQITIFSSRLKKPIDVELRQDQGNIIFNVQNHSYYPYSFEVKFGPMSNLSPIVYSRTVKIYPGNTRLFTFKIIDPNKEPIISYQISYALAGTTPSEEKFKPYLIPIGNNKTVEIYSEKIENSNRIYLNQYVLNTGDTVFSSRKGIITATPDYKMEIDRIMDSNSLEILHDDGTVAIYQGLSFGVNLINLGQKVFPGQPIGIIGSSRLLKFYVLEFQNDGRIKTINILYSGSDNNMLAPNIINGTKVHYPDNIVTQEMNKKEISRYKKGSLY